MNQEEVNILIDKYLDNLATPQERERLLAWYRDKNDGEIEWIADDPDEENTVKAEMFNAINRQINHVEQKSSRITHWYRFAAAAIILCTISAGFYFYKILPDEKHQYTQDKRIDIKPGSNTAILTLADGSKISLDDASTGEVADQNGIKITKNADGQLVYTISDSKLSKEVRSDNALNSKPLYNTIETPKGGQYQINLPDGTKVWLNAAASLKYPTMFTGNERNVELSGEAYFEVAENANKPFQVLTTGQRIKVLGTHFNINAYGDEEGVKTTLLEGSIKVSLVNSTISKILEPGQQLVVSERGFDIQNVDTEDVTAWKNGYFIFKDEDLESIMREVSRWYNVEIHYARKPVAQTFLGVVSRSKNVSAVLHALESTGKVRFKIEEKRITVL